MCVYIYIGVCVFLFYKFTQFKPVLICGLSNDSLKSVSYFDVCVYV